MPRYPAAQSALDFLEHTLGIPKDAAATYAVGLAEQSHVRPEQLCSLSTEELVRKMSRCIAERRGLLHQQLRHDLRLLEMTPCRSV
eukprot:COSAG06_NODE_35656_length_457_cov_0.902235_1_plen_86_part_00